MEKVLVIGATGNVGRHVVAQLAERGAAVRAMVRDPRRANLPAGVEVVQGDLTAPDSLDACLDGTGGVFLVWTAPGAAFDRAWERIAKTASRVVYLSAPLKTQHPFFQQPNPGSALAARIERTIEDSGVPWTFLRPHMFAGNAVGFWARQIRAGEAVRWPYLETPTAPIEEADIAAVGVKALCEGGHEGAEYVITGPESLTQREQIATIGRAIGRELEVEEMTPEEARTELLAVFGAQFVVDLLMNAWAAGAGQPAHVTQTFGEVMARAPRRFVDWARDHAQEFI